MANIDLQSDYGLLLKLYGESMLRIGQLEARVAALNEGDAENSQSRAIVELTERATQFTGWSPGYPKLVRTLQTSVRQMGRRMKSLRCEYRSRAWPTSSTWLAMSSRTTVRGDDGALERLSTHRYCSPLSADSVSAVPRGCSP